MKVRVMIEKNEQLLLDILESTSEDNPMENQHVLGEFNDLYLSQDGRETLVKEVIRHTVREKPKGEVVSAFNTARENLVTSGAIKVSGAGEENALLWIEETITNS